MAVEARTGRPLSLKKIAKAAITSVLEREHWQVYSQQRAHLFVAG